MTLATSLSQNEHITAEKSAELLLSICSQMTSEYMFNVHRRPLHELMPVKLLHDIEHLIDDMYSYPDHHWLQHVLLTLKRCTDGCSTESRDPMHIILFTLYQYRSYQRAFCATRDSKNKTAIVIEMLEEFIGDTSQQKHVSHHSKYAKSWTAHLILLSQWMSDKMSVIG